MRKIRKHFGPDGPGVSVLVGVGDMTRQVAQALQHCPGKRLFVNRTFARAQELASGFGGEALSLEAFHTSPPSWIDLMFTATSAPDPVIRAPALEPTLAARRTTGGRPLIVCDMGVPRDVDPALEGRPGLLLVALQNLELLARVNRARREKEIQRARGIIASEALRLAREDRFRDLASTSARAILDSRLAHLDLNDRETILRFATGLAERFARQPLDPEE